MKIIFEDKDLLALNKPPNIVVNRAVSLNEITVQDWFEKYFEVFSQLENEEDWGTLIPPGFDSQYGSAEDIFKSRRGMVHRLDRETSGVLLFAKNPGSLVNLLDQFKSRMVEKEYLSLVHGKLRFKAGTINAPIGRASKDRKKFSLKIEGREAKTDYELKEVYPGINFIKELNPPALNLTELLGVEAVKQLRKNKKTYEQGFSLVKCMPKTGRTHQVRVHFKHFGNSLVGDKKYGGKKRAKLDGLWCSRHFLHASKLTITHPRTKKKQIFEAELPGDLKQVLSIVR